MSQPKKMRGPQHREMRNAFPQAKEVGVGAPTQRLSKRKPTDKASWGGPQHREMRNTFPQAKEVEFQQKNYVKIVPCF